MIHRMSPRQMLDPLHFLHLLLWRWCSQMPDPLHSSIVSFGAGARRCPIPCTPCMCSFGAGARRCPIPCTPCIASFGAGARRCSIPCIPCISSSGAGARKCPIPCTPCIFSFGAGARRCSIPRIPCIGSFGAGARRCSIPCIPCIGSLCAGARRCPIPCIPCMCSFGTGARTCLPFAYAFSGSRWSAPPRQPHQNASPCEQIPDDSLASSHQKRSAATASTFAAFYAQGYHSCSRPGQSSAPCAVASSLRQHSLTLLVSASIPWCTGLRGRARCTILTLYVPGKVQYLTTAGNTRRFLCAGSPGQTGYRNWSSFVSHKKSERPVPVSGLHKSGAILIFISL